MDHPFVYIAALRRSGSTILSELLTDPPRSFIFREPNLARGRFDLKPDDAELFRGMGLDLEAFSRKWCGWRKRRLVAGFRKDVVRPLEGKVQQIGVKEIMHDHWRSYLRQFPAMRVVVLARDPRDIYLSILERRAKGVNASADDTTPEIAATNLMRQFEHQRAMLDECQSMWITYDTLCSDPGAFDRVRTFVDSPLTTAGKAGRFNEKNPVRSSEAAIHGGAVTTKRVGRWQTESNPELRDKAQRVFELMRPYAEFFGFN